MSLVLSAACRSEREARRKWGDAAQAFMVCEEAGELATAMAQFTRGRLQPKELLATVLAGFDAGDLIEAVQRKLARLDRRLRGEEGHFGQAAPTIEADRKVP